MRRWKCDDPDPNGKIGDNPRVDEWSRSAFKWGFNSRKNKCSIRKNNHSLKCGVPMVACGSPFEKADKVVGGERIKRQADALHYAGGAQYDAAKLFQRSTPKQAIMYWSSFATTIALAFAWTFWWVYSPGQDHLASISLNGDGAWYQNYELRFEVQDHEIFFHGSGTQSRTRAKPT